jgi:SAM-dependent methyltransferase
MWIARELGADLVGVDFSAEAIAQASERRALFGLEDRATFAVGSLEDTGLPAGSADGVICIDAFQFGKDGDVVASEMRRVLRPGGTVVLTSWEAADPAAAEMPDWLRDANLSGSLAAAGFTDVVTEGRPAWRANERAFWEHVVTLDPNGDPAIESTRAEAERSLANFDALRRVFATATAL